MFKRVLIANRGEIANRIIGTLRKLKIESIVIYDERERDAPFVRNADISVSLGSGPLRDTYLHVHKIIGIAKEYGCDAIHPGYGFLSENDDFARECISGGIVFVGPQPATLASMGNKIKSTQLAQRIGIPVIPQIRGSIEEIVQQVTRDFFPCLVKASAGGGGKGMRQVHDKKELKALLVKTSREAEKYFGSGEVYIEKYLIDPRHVEVQILADSLGNTIHLFERECSVQRRFQKIIEEAPAPGMHKLKKEILYKDALTLAREVDYLGAGTVEFLIDTEGNHYFLEMNTRIQVEHGVTEMITGVDIVKEQLAIAAGASISPECLQATIKGHAIEARLYAEDPAKDFKPSPGIVNLVRFPGIKNVRIDSDFQNDSRVLVDFDPLMAKLIAFGEDRKKAITKLKKAVGETIVHGVKHNLDAVLNILNEKDFIANTVSTHYLEKHPEVLVSQSDHSLDEAATLLAAGLFISFFRYPQITPLNSNSTFRDFWRMQKNLAVSLNEMPCTIGLESLHLQGLSFLYGEETIECKILQNEENYIDLTLSAQPVRVFYSWDSNRMIIRLSIDHRIHAFYRYDFLQRRDFSRERDSHAANGSSNIKAPLNGKVIKIHVSANQVAEKGECLLVIESMKMENEVRIPATSRITKIAVKEGQLISEGDLLLIAKTIR